MQHGMYRVLRFEWRKVLGSIFLDLNKSNVDRAKGTMFSGEMFSYFYHEALNYVFLKSNIFVFRIHSFFKF